MVAGLLFSSDQKQVALILKNRPAWQAGRLNGIEGKIEAGESPLKAMRREFAEKTGWTGDIPWKHFCSMGGDGWLVVWFKAFDSSDAIVLRKVTDEKPHWFNIGEVISNDIPEGDVIPNVRWLVQMALDMDNPKGYINYEKPSTLTFTS